MRLTLRCRFLMLPATYVESSTLRVNQTAVGIFGIAILTAGFSFSALLSFTIRNPLFQAEEIHQPCGIASIVGLLTVFYHFIVSSTYTWKTPTLLLAIAAGISTIVYAGLFLLSQRRISQIRSQPRQADHVPLGSASPARTSFTTGPAVSTYEPTTERSSSYQPTGYYENYIRNMYPTSTRGAHSPPGEPTGAAGYDPHSISEEEMQRQQMLMLLLANDQPAQSVQQQAQSSTYNIDWQGQDADADDAPAHGYYAPGAGTGSGSSGVGTGASWPSAELPPSPSRWPKLKMRPWDGVWRGVTRREEQRRNSQQQQQQQQQVLGGREERRREIELGLR